MAVHVRLKNGFTEDEKYHNLMTWLIQEDLDWAGYEPRHDKTNQMSVRPAKTQISLGIRPVWSESSLFAQWIAKDPNFLHTDSEDSDQTAWMPSLIWVFAGRTLTLLVLSCHGSYDFHTLKIWKSWTPEKMLYM